MTSSSNCITRALVARVRSIGAQLKDEPFQQDPDWLLLPVAKQDLVQQRLTALRAYDEIEKPTSVDALRAAKAAGVAIARFYQLVNHWRSSNRSPMSLVPHARLTKERSTRLPAEETADAITVAISRILKEKPTAETGEIISLLRRTWRGPGELPSDTALRLFHERVIRSSIPTPGTLTLKLGGSPQEEGVAADHFLDTLVIDHVGIKHVVVEHDGLPPTITLAMDLWSGSPVGIAVTAGPPTPQGVLHALQDVARRIGVVERGNLRTPERSSQVRPRIVMASTYARQWQLMSEALLSEGFEVVERRDVFIHQGGPARRLLGMALGRFRLERRADRRYPFGFDPNITAVLGLDVIARLLSEAIDGVTAERIPTDGWATAIPFDIDHLLSDLGDAIAVHHNEDVTEPVKARRGRPSTRAPNISRLIRNLVDESVPGRVKEVQVVQSDDQVWHLTVAVVDQDRRDEAFLKLAERAMALSAVQSVPIVVHIETVEDQSKH